LRVLPANKDIALPHLFHHSTDVSPPLFL
jgi:hypothetical protein